MTVTARSDRFRFLPLAACVAAVALAAAGCGGSSSSSSMPKSGVAGAQHATGALVATRTIKGLGTVLVDSRGRTLYTFAPDRHKRVTCTGSCASVWPPLKLQAGRKAAAGGAVHASLLATDPNPGGGRVVTYAGWPLYTYVADGSPGEAKGQGLNLNGGVWHVISPSGHVVRTTTTSGGGGTTTTSGGGGWG